MIRSPIEGSARRADQDGLNGNDTKQKEEVEAARREQVVINVGALSNKELKPLME